ncbi:MAG: hypothetical protein CSA68_11125, partial [Rhodobacterales bacterium]
EFRSQTETALPVLQEAIAKGDHEQARKTAHRLKGAASNFGLEAFCRMLGDIEDSARAGRDQSARSATLKTAFETAMQMLNDAARLLEIKGATG